MKWIVPTLALMLAGCGERIESTPEPLVVVKEVVIPGPPVPCVPKALGDEPAYADTNEALKNAADGAVRYQLIIAGRAQRISRLGELEPVVKGCPKAE